MSTRQNGFISLPHLLLVVGVVVVILLVAGLVNRKQGTSQNDWGDFLSKFETSIKPGDSLITRSRDASCGGIVDSTYNVADYGFQSQNSSASRQGLATKVQQKLKTQGWQAETSASGQLIHATYPFSSGSVAADFNLIANAPDTFSVYIVGPHGSCSSHNLPEKISLDLTTAQSTTPFTIYKPTYNPLGQISSVKLIGFYDFRYLLNNSAAELASESLPAAYNPQNSCDIFTKGNYNCSLLGESSKGYKIYQNGSNMVAQVNNTLVELLLPANQSLSKDNIFKIFDSIVPLPKQ